MQFNIVPEPTLSPTCCFLCRGGAGPFVHVQGIKIVGIVTAEGPKEIVGGVYICIGSGPNSGCLPQMVELAGGYGPVEAGRVRRTIETMEIEIQDAENREAALQIRLEEARPRVVRVDELDGYVR
jgi:hypothetical protein